MLSRRLGRGLALSCIEKPEVYAMYRKLWAAEIRRSLNGRHLPAAFVQCARPRLPLVAERLTGGGMLAPQGPTTED